MSVNIVTSEDLGRFRESLLKELTELLTKHKTISIDHWIKSAEVMDQLGISPGTLQNFRVNGTLPFSKLGGILFYDQAKIDSILRENESSNQNGVL